jgi:D-glycero-D-manno-heptose 1,7-bisphosphate phosphatase
MGGGAEVRRAIFFDRDGVLNRVVMRGAVVSSPRSLSEFVLAEGAAEVVARRRGAGFLIFVVTNQPDVARGLLDPLELEAISASLRAELGVDEVLACPHEDRDDCECRKPRPGMLMELAARWGVELASSYMVGDTWRDMEAGRAAGCGTVLVRWPYNEGVGAEIVVDTLAEVADQLLREG